MSNKIPHRQDAVNKHAADPEPSSNLSPRTPAGDALSELTVMIFRLNGQLLAAGDALAGSAGQTSAHWRVMAAVENRPMSVAQIARGWGLARQSVQRVANVLVREGWAVYEENPNHRRAQLLVLTPKGRSALSKVQSAQRVWANALGEQLGEADLRQASAILSRLLRVVAEGTDG